MAGLEGVIVRSLAVFSRYVVNVKKRLIAHFGMSERDADEAIAHAEARLAAWCRSGMAPDRAARIIYDSATAGAGRIENPIPNGALWFIAGALAGVGVYFVARSITPAQPAATSVPPPALPDYSSGSPEVLQTLGPVGVQPETVSTSV
jgi:hypothetical protein